MSRPTSINRSSSSDSSSELAREEPLYISLVPPEAEEESEARIWTCKFWRAVCRRLVVDIVTSGMERNVRNPIMRGLGGEISSLADWIIPLSKLTWTRPNNTFGDQSVCYHRSIYALSQHSRVPYSKGCGLNISSVATPHLCATSLRPVHGPNLRYAIFLPLAYFLPFMLAILLICLSLTSALPSNTSSTYFQPSHKRLTRSDSHDSSRSHLCGQSDRQGSSPAEFSVFRRQLHLLRADRLCQNSSPYRGRPDFDVRRSRRRI